jgi:hypothetical protein
MLKTMLNAYLQHMGWLGVIILCTLMASTCQPHRRANMSFAAVNCSNSAKKHGLLRRPARGGSV